MNTQNRRLEPSRAQSKGCRRPFAPSRLAPTFPGPQARWLRQTVRPGGTSGERQPAGLLSARARRPTIKPRFLKTGFKWVSTTFPPCFSGEPRRNRSPTVTVDVCISLCRYVHFYFTYCESVLIVADKFKTVVLFLSFTFNLFLSSCIRCI